MANRSAYVLSLPEERPFDCAFLRAAKDVLRWHPHLNKCDGSESAKRKKLEGKLGLRLREVIDIFKAARQQGGAELVGRLAMALLEDTLPPGAEPDVITRTADPYLVPIGTREQEELGVSVAAARLLMSVEDAVADQHLDIREEAQLEGQALVAA